MGVIGMKIVVRPVEVRRHDRDEIAAMLLAIGLTQLDARYFCQSVPFVRRLKRAGKQRFLRDRLRGLARIDAGRAQKQKLLDLVRKRALDHIQLDLQILVQKISGMKLIGENSAHLRRREEDNLRLVRSHPALHGAGARQIERRPVGGEDGAVFGGETANNGAARKSAMARNPDLFSTQAVGITNRNTHKTTHFNRDCL